MAFWCKHDDEILETREIPSACEQNKKSDLVSDLISIISDRWYYQKVIVTVVRCKKCGRVKHVKTVGPG